MGSGDKTTINHARLFLLVRGWGLGTRLPSIMRSLTAGARYFKASVKPVTANLSNGFTNGHLGIYSGYNPLPRQHISILLVSFFYSGNRLYNSYIPPWGWSFTLVLGSSCVFVAHWSVLFSQLSSSSDKLLSENILDSWLTTLSWYYSDVDASCTKT